MGTAVGSSAIDAAIRIARSNVLRMQAQGAARTDASVFLAAASLHEAVDHGAGIVELAVRIGVAPGMIAEMLRLVPDERLVALR